MDKIIINKHTFNYKSDLSASKFNYKLQRKINSFEVIFNYPFKSILSCMFYNTKLAKITLPQSVKTIEYAAFYGCKELKEIILPPPIEKIDESAFAYCTNLKRIFLPATLKEIKILDSSYKSAIFFKCNSLEEIQIDQSKEDFFKNVKNAQNFYKEYGYLISFKDNSLGNKLNNYVTLEEVLKEI